MRAHRIGALALGRWGPDLTPAPCHTSPRVTPGLALPEVPSWNHSIHSEPSQSYPAVTLAPAAVPEVVGVTWRTCPELYSDVLAQRRLSWAATSPRQTIQQRSWLRITHVGGVRPAGARSRQGLRALHCAHTDKLGQHSKDQYSTGNDLTAIQVRQDRRCLATLAPACLLCACRLPTFRASVRGLH